MYGVNVPKNCQAAVEFYKPAVDVVVHDVLHFRPPPMMERYSLAPEGSKPRYVYLCVYIMYKRYALAPESSKPRDTCVCVGVYMCNV